MSVFRQLLVAAPAALLLVTATAPNAAAQSQRTLFTWSGQVDSDASITIRGRNISTKASNMTLSLPPRVDVRESMPTADGDLRVQLTNGRGNVEVVQHPSARNDYTGIVRIVDNQSGRGDYRMVVSWVPVGNGGYDNRTDDRYDPRDPRYDPRTDPRYDPRNDPRNDPRYDPRNDRNRNDDCWYDGNNGSNNGNGKAKGKSKNKAQGKAKGHDKNSRNDDRYDDCDDRNDDRYDNRNNNRNVASWRGAVDDVIEMRIQGRRISYRTLRGQQLRNARFDAGNRGIPNQPVRVAISNANGRGNVTVVQQPSRNNNFTTIIRVADRQSGFGTYNFDIRWN